MAGNTLFVSLPVPAGNGVGAPVDVSGTVRFKSFMLSGPVPAGSVYAIEASMDGTSWDTLVVLTQPPPGLQTVQATCRFVRVRRNATGAPPVITLGAEFLAGVSSGVADVHTSGSPPLVGSVELLAGANIALTQTGNQIEIAASVVAPPPPSGGGNPLFATLSYADLRSFVAPPGGGPAAASAAGAGPPPPSDLLLYQVPLALPATPPNFAFDGRGIYALGVGSVTFRLKMAAPTDLGTTGGFVFATTIAFPAARQLFALGGTFVHPGAAFGDSGIFKLTAEFSDPTATLDMLGITVRILNS